MHERVYATPTVLRERERERERRRQRECEIRQPVKYDLRSFIFSGPARLYTTKITNMKTEEMTNMPRVRIAVLGKINVGKSGKNLLILLWESRKMGCNILYSINIILYLSNLRILKGRRTFVTGNNTDEWRTHYTFTLCLKRGLRFFALLIAYIKPVSFTNYLVIQRWDHLPE